MRLRHVEIRQFRSIREASFSVASDVTAVVGANESGKSNILRAIREFSADGPFQVEDVGQTPALGDRDVPPPSVALAFSEMTADEAKRVADLVRELLISETSRELADVKTALSNVEQEIEQAEAAKREIGRRLSEQGPLTEKARAEADARSQELTMASAELGGVQQQHTASPSPESERALQTQQERVQAAQAAADAANASASAATALQQKLSEEMKASDTAIPTFSKQLESLQKRHASLSGTVEAGEKVAAQIEADRRISVRRVGGEDPRLEIAIHGGPYEISGDGASRLRALLPRIVMVGNEDKLEGAVSLTELEASQDGHRAVRSLLTIGGIASIADLRDPTRKDKLIFDARRKVSEFIRERWSQDNSIGVELIPDGDQLRVRFCDQTDAVVGPENRSPGFLEHASLHIILAADVDAQALQGCVVLVDELGIRLHPEGQRDFLRVLEDLGIRNQVLYTTHSPFMVNRNHPERILLVTKPGAKGTVVNDRPHQDRWQPLRSALGVALGDSFLFGEKNVLVEGPTEQYIMTAVSQALARVGGSPGLDLNDTNVVPACSASVMKGIAKLLEEHARCRCVVTLDADKHGDDVRRALERLGFPSEKTVTTGQVVTREGTVTIEDLVPADLYLNAVKQCYSELGRAEWVPGALDPERPFVEQLEAGLPEDLGELDKVGIAIELAQILRAAPERIRPNDGEKYAPIVRFLGALSELLEAGEPVDKQRRRQIESTYGLSGEKADAARRKAIQDQSRKRASAREPDAGEATGGEPE
jgi:hypothetical protein